MALDAISRAYIDYIKLNIGNFELNRKIEVQVVAEKDTELSNKLGNLLLDLRNGNAIVDAVESLSSRESEAFSEIVNRIRSGSVVSLISSDASTDVLDYFNINPSLDDSPISEKASVPVNSIFEAKREQALARLASYGQEDLTTKPSTRIIITNPTDNQLPSWHEVVTQLSRIDQPLEWEQWCINVATQKYWAERYPDLMDSSSPENVPLPPQDAYDIRQLNQDVDAS